MSSAETYRAVFDATVTFSNGGDLSVRGFRLDVARADVTPHEVAPALVAHLGLLMVADVRFDAFEVVAEAHKGGRAVAPAEAAARQIVDLAHVITDGMVTYPGIPGPRLGSHLTFDESVGTYAPGTEFSMGTVDIAANTGTYLDTPAHRYRDGVDLAGFPLDRMVDLPGVVIRVVDGFRAGERPAVDALALAGVEVAGQAVLIETGHSRHWGTDAYFADHPFLTADAAAWLVDRGAALVGIDSLNIDGTHTGERPAHTALLGAGIPVVEHLTGLDALPPTGFRFSAPPPKIAGLGTFTVRAFAVIDG